jgi:hypothetical protein
LPSKKLDNFHKYTVVRIVIRSLLFLYSIFLLMRFSGSNNDFKVFYQASFDLLHGFNPWLGSNDPNTMYLYGPVTTLAIAPISMININTAVFILRIVSIFSLWIIAYRLHFPETRVNREVYLAILLLSVGTTSNLFYGQLQIPIFCGFIYIAHCLLQEKRKPITVLIISFLSCIMLDQKPHIAIFVLIILFKCGRYKELILILVTEILAGTIVSIQIRSIWFLDYLDALLFRLESTRNGRDSMALMSIFSEFGFSSSKWIFLFIYFAGIFIACKFNDSNRERTILVLPILILLSTPLLHPSDLLYVLPLIVLLVEREMHGILVPLRLIMVSCAFAWSNQISISVSIAILTFFIVTSTSKQRRIRSISNFVLAIIPSLVIPVIFINFPAQEGLGRHIVNFLVLPISFYLYTRLKPTLLRAK